MATDVRQTHFCFGKDDGTESTHTFWQNEDTNHSQLVDTNWTFLLRFTEQESGGTAAANTDAQFQYNKNAAGWVNITTTSSVVKAVAVGAFTDGANCTKRLNGTGTFELSGAGCTEDGLSGGTANDIAASGNSETEAGLQVVAADVAHNDTIQFRFTSPDWTITYTITPTLTVTKTQLSAVGDTVQSVWNVKQAIGDIVRPIWNIRAVLGDTIRPIWNVKTAIGDTLRPIWGVRTTVGDEVNSKWNILTAVGKTVQSIWNVFATLTADKSVQLVWNVRYALSDSVQAVWNVLTSVTKTSQVVWNVLTTLGKQTQYIWNVRQVVGDTFNSIWNVMANVSTVAKSLQIKWNVLAWYFRVAVFRSRSMDIEVSTSNQGMAVTSSSGQGIDIQVSTGV